MTTLEDMPVMHRIIQIRVPDALAAALDKASSRRFMTLSDVVRDNLAAAMRAQGLLDA